jgi:hypothetical protein
MRKTSFHVCCSQIDTGTCDMCLTCDEKVRSIRKETGKNRRKTKTQHPPPLAENLRRTEKKKKKERKKILRRKEWRDS